MTPSRPKASATTAQSLILVSSTANTPGEDSPKLLEWLMLGSGAPSGTEHPPARSITCTDTRPSTVRAAPAQRPQAHRRRTRSESTQVVIHQRVQLHVPTEGRLPNSRIAFRSSTRDILTRLGPDLAIRTH